MHRVLTGAAYFELEDIAYPATVTRAVVRPEGLALEVEGTLDGKHYRLEANLAREGTSCSGRGEMLENGKVSDRCAITLRSTYLTAREWGLSGELTFLDERGADEPISVSLELEFLQ